MFNLIFSLVFAFFALIAILVGVLKARKKTMFESLFRIPTVIISAVLSTFLSALASWGIGKLLYNVIINALGSGEPSGPDIAGLTKEIPSLPDIAAALIAMILAPILFTTIFLILKAVLNKFVVKKWLVKLVEKHDSKKAAPLSFVFNALASFFVFVVLLMPYLGGLKLVGSIGVMASPEPDHIVAQISDAAINNVGTKTVSVLGGDLVYSGLTTYKVNGQKMSMAKESGFITSLGEGMLKLSDENVSSADKAAALRTSGEALSNTTLVPTLLSDVVNAAENHWEKNEAFYGIERPTLAGNEHLTEAILGCLADSTRETMRADLKSIINLAAILIENDAMDAFEDMHKIYELFENKKVVTDLAVELLNNKRLAPALTELANISFEIVCDSLDVPNNSDEAYNRFIDDVYEAYSSNATSAPTAESVEKLSKALHTVFDNYGVVVDEGVETCIAASLLCSDTLDADGIKTFFSSGSTITLSSSKDYDVTTIYNDVSKLYAVGDTADALKAKILTLLAEYPAFDSDKEKVAELLAQDLIDTLSTGVKNPPAKFESADDFVSKCAIITADEILAAGETIDDIPTEAGHFADTTVALTFILDHLASDNSGIAVILRDFGPFLDSFKGSKILGSETASEILMATMQSKAVRSSLGLTLRSATDVTLSMVSASGTEGYTHLLGSLSNTITVLENTSGTNHSTEEIAALMKDMTPAAAEAIQKMATPEVIQNYGISEEKSESVSNLISDVFGNMSDAKTNSETPMTDEQYQKESDAIHDMMMIAMSAASNTSDKTTFGEDSATGVTATEYVERVLDSEVISKTLVDNVYTDGETATIDPLKVEEMLTQEEKQEIADVISDKWAEQLKNSSDPAANAELQKKLTAIASIVNVQVSF